MKHPALASALCLLLMGVVSQSAEIRTQVGEIKDTRTTGKFFAGLEVELKLFGDDLDGVKGMRTKVTKAVDDTGRDLIEQEKMEAGFSSSQFGAKDAVTLKLKNPARKATAIKELSGAIELHMPKADPQATVVTPPLKTILGKPLDAPQLKAAGISIVVLNKQQFDAQKETEKKKKSAGAKNPGNLKDLEKAMKDPSSVTPEMGKAIGEALTDAFAGVFGGFAQMNEGDLAFLIKDPQSRIVALEVVDADGRKIDTRSSSTSGDSTKQTKIINYGRPLPEDAKVQVNLQTEKSIVSIPLNLTSIPLP